jgi:hypothetical protein
MLGLLVTSPISGQAVSCTGRYKLFPAFGSLFMVVGMYLRSNLGLHTSHLVMSASVNQSFSMSPSRLRNFPLAIQHGILESLMRSLHTVFLVGVPLAEVTFVLTLFLKEVHLRTDSGLEHPSEDVAMAGEVSGTGEAEFDGGVSGLGAVIGWPPPWARPFPCSSGSSPSPRWAPPTTSRSGWPRPPNGWGSTPSSGAITT